MDNTCCPSFCKPESPLPPGSLQQRIGKMLKRWVGIENANLHRGRRTVTTNIIHTQENSIKTAQTVLGKKKSATTLIYRDPPEAHIADVSPRINPTE